MNDRTVVRFCVASDLQEGNGSRGPKPRGWQTRFRESFTKGAPNDCWEWTGNILNTGYGSLSIANVHYLAHRLAFLIGNGRINPDLLVMHSCDNRKCVNPKHLSQGTDADNVRDAWLKGRTQKGERNGMAKLSEAEVTEIKRKFRSGHSSMSQLAKQYRVWGPCIWRIIRGLRWKHIP